MPTFTALALDRLLEPGAAKSVPKPPVINNNNNNMNSDMRKSYPTAIISTTEKKIQWPQVSPSLYATPEATPLPDSPSSFPPSPYIINHKRRGPRLLKSFSQDDVVRNQEENGQNEDKKLGETKESKEMKAVDSVGEFSFVPTVSGACEELGTNGFHNGVFGKDGVDDEGGKVDNLSKSLAVNVNAGTDTECEDFFDPNDSMSATSVADVEDGSGHDRSFSFKSSTPVAEYFDAFEELYSEGGTQCSPRNIEVELREMRMNLLMEIEKRKQAEEALDNTRRQWQRFVEQASLVGLRLPAFTVFELEDENGTFDFAQDLCQQVYIARAVSNSIGRGLAKAEVEMEMESQLEGKNFEIARLWDRVRYYEAVNHEMSQRNQEAIELARHRRQRRKRRQRWVWGSIGAAIALGSVALAWSFLPSSSSAPSQSVDGDDASKP